MMKLKKIFATVLIITASTSFAGAWFSKPKPLLKIAKAETLRAQSARLLPGDFPFLASLGVFEALGETELSESEICQKIDHIVDTAWEQEKEAVRQKIGADRFAKEEVLYEDACDRIKQSIYTIVTLTPEVEKDLEKRLEDYKLDQIRYLEEGLLREIQ